MAEESPKPNIAKPQELSYARDGHLVHKHNRRRKLFFISGLLALIISGYWWAPAAYKQAVYRISLYQCRNHEFSPRTIVIDTTIRPHYWGQRLGFLDAAYPGLFSVAPVYVHQRRDANSPKTVIVLANSQLGPVSVKHLNLNVTLDGTGNYSTSFRLIENTNFGSFKIFAGQTDPNDTSHFTIDYVDNGQPGTIDGYLRNGKVILQERHTPSAQPPSPSGSR